MKKHVHPFRVIVAVSCIGSGIVASLLALIGPIAQESNFFSYYINLAVGPISDAFSFLFVFCFAAIFSFLAFSLFANAFYHKRDPHEFFSWDFLKKNIRLLGRGLGELMLEAGPVILTFVFVSLAMASINPVNATHLIDDRVVEWDRALLNSYPFISFTNISWPGWFIRIVAFSFMDLPVFIIAFSLYVFAFQRKIFREMAAVFCFSLVLMLFLWQIFPVLSPHDRYLDNVYNLPNSPSMNEALKKYEPQPLIEKFLSEMRERKNQSLGGTMPTSTLPSAHVAWATLLVYYVWRVKKQLLLLFFPIAFLSTIGTFLFAQHYFVDVPAGIAVMMFAIYLVRFTNRKHK
ncbi:MAG: phosphatase PAP2 family protein [Patescibacteria group bacterium]